MSLWSPWFRDVRAALTDIQQWQATMLSRIDNVRELVAQHGEQLDVLEEAVTKTQVDVAVLVEELTDRPRPSAE